MIALMLASVAVADDPPHDASWAIDCSGCHTSHASPEGGLKTVTGNANLCLSCHVTGGLAAGFPFVDADQALPSPGLPPGMAASGSSHRWDSGPAGHVRADAGNASVGKIVPQGVFSGRVPKTYMLTITSAGDSGAAQFSWSDSLGGGAAGLTTGAAVPLDQGVSVSFVDGGSSPSFLVGDGWQIFVRTEINPPAAAAMASRLDAGRAMCSTCHNQHKQSMTPFDPGAPPYGGAGTGEGRHYVRVDNDDSSMCTDCHSARNVLSVDSGSHPVGTLMPGAGEYQLPSALPLDPTGRVVCMSCHTVHAAATADGSLLRLADRRGLCTECHTLADVSTPAAHLDPSDPDTVWPGGQYGSTFPAIADASQQGSCGNCHLAHGWPDAGNTARDYPRLLVDLEEGLCLTCHDGGPAVDVDSDFAKASVHPLGLATEIHAPGEPVLVSDRHVECADCHGPHDAASRVDLPGPSSVPRPASGPLAGIQGIDIAGSGVNPASFEYELCFRCHADSTGMPAPSTPRQFPAANVREEFGGSFASYHPVAVAGKNPDVPSLISPWTTGSLMSCTTCHNNDTGPAAGGSGANGPHGSVWPSLLERRYDTADNTSFTTDKYAMCFKCHSSSSIQSGTSFSDHNKHISGARTPCNVCHDPHASSGNPKLINFDTSVVRPLNGVLEYRSTGRFRGQCTLSCHGKNHNGLSY